VLTVLSGLLVAGCRHEAAPVVDNATAEVELATVDSRGLAEVVARHRGKVVLVDFWATWCAPCVKLFPHTVELQQRLADQGLVVISVSMDDVKDREAVLRFLRDHRSTFENFISQYGVGSEGFDAFDIGDGALPNVKLYGRDGRLQKTFSSGGQPLDPKEIERAVVELTLVPRFMRNRESGVGPESGRIPRE
jgi:thiol-disulfide isomerase/thioredoxin